MIPIMYPPEIALTEPLCQVRRRFDDEDANMSSVLLSTFRDSAPEVRFIQLVPDWKGPSFEQLAVEQPQDLLALVLKGRLAEHDLTFAAEALGRVDEALSLPVLFALARDSSRLVREGAVYGLSRHVRNADVRAVLMRMSKEDPSPGVRTTAAEALDD
jgi:HEAT repeat protein